jgi:hypothetical protein
MNSNLNYNVVKTALDDVFMQEFKPNLFPGFIDATNGLVFVHDSKDRAAIIVEIFIVILKAKGREKHVNTFTVNTASRGSKLQTRSRRE